MAKRNLFAVVAFIMALCAAVFMVSCSGSDLDGNQRETPVTPEVSTSVDNTYVEHNWVEEKNSFVDDVTSVTEYTEYEKKSLRVKLPATIKWTSNEALRTSKTFDAAEVTLGEEVEDLCDALSKADTTVFAHDRELTETFAETTIEMNTRWLNGYVYIDGEKSQLAYVQLDSVKAMPELTTVKFHEWADEANKIERDSFAMPHKAYYTEVSLSGKKNHVKTFTVKGTFLYQQVEEGEPQDTIPETPEIPEEPQDTIPETPEEPTVNKEDIVDATFVTRWFDMDSQKSFMTLNCLWNNGETEEVTFWMAMPFGWSFPSEWTAPARTEGPSKFVKLSKNSDNPSYAQTSESNASEYGAITMRRKVTQTTIWSYTDFEENLTSFHHEGYLMINGKDFQFMAPSESTARGGEEQTTTNEGNNSIEKNTITAEISFNHSTFHESGIVNVIRANNEEPEEPETPAEEEKPAEDENKDDNTPVADDNTIPSEWGEITGVVGVTRIVETINKQDFWHTCLVIRTTKGQIRVVDKKWKQVTNAFMSFNEIYDNARMISGGYVDGVLYPASISFDTTGWTYLIETKIGVNQPIDMPENRAVTGGIKNFTKDNTAKPTPIVDYTPKFETKNGKKILTVTCFNVDGKTTDVFSINCLLSK